MLLATQFSPYLYLFETASEVEFGKRVFLMFIFDLGPRVVIKVLKTLNIHKFIGPDGITSRMFALIYPFQEESIVNDKFTFNLEPNEFFSDIQYEF